VTKTKMQKRINGNPSRTSARPVEPSGLVWFLDAMDIPRDGTSSCSGPVL
jgi:hypothetical protein